MQPVCLCRHAFFGGGFLAGVDFFGAGFGGAFLAGAGFFGAGALQ